jgi:hypothetical protein
MPHGGPPRAVPLSPAISLIVANVPAEIYNAKSIESRLSDLDWVADVGVAHHAVIDAVAEDHAVLPFRLFTLFSSERKATKELDKRRTQIATALQRVSGRQEWVLRIAPPDAALADSTPTPERKQSVTGTNFLRAKADARRTATERASRVTLGVDRVFAALQPLADDVARRPGGDAQGLLLDAAFLVETSRIDAFRETLSETAAGLLRDGCRVSVTGPWPPYSFASLDAATDD